MPRKPKTQKQQPKPKKPRPSLHEKNQLNELTGDRWMWFTKSLVTTTYPMEFGHKLRKAHGANKPPRLMQEQIEFFTKGGGLVLDPFAGVGGTLIGASVAEPPRRAIGIEISQEWADIYLEVCAQEGMEPQEMLVGDCLAANLSVPMALTLFEPMLYITLALTLLSGLHYSYISARIVESSQRAAKTNAQQGNKNSGS